MRLFTKYAKNYHITQEKWDIFRCKTRSCSTQAQLAHFTYKKYLTTPRIDHSKETLDANVIETPLKNETVSNIETNTAYNCTKLQNHVCTHIIVHP